MNHLEGRYLEIVPQKGYKQIIRHSKQLLDLRVKTGEEILGEVRRVRRNPSAYTIRGRYGQGEDSCLKTNRKKT